MALSTIARAFKPLDGLPCWRVQPGYGDCLTLEFGQPELHIIEPRPSKPGTSARLRRLHARRIVTPYGAYHLWIYLCNWQVAVNGQVIGDNSSHRRALRAAKALDGQALVAVEVDPEHGATRLHFDLGGHLKIWPLKRAKQTSGMQPEKPDELWILYLPKGRVLTVRADGQYSYGRDTAINEVWRPLNGKQ